MWINKLFTDRDCPNESEIMEDCPDEGLDYLLSIVEEIHEMPDEFHMVDSLTGDMIDLEPKQFLSKLQIDTIKDVLETVEVITVKQLKELL